MMKISKKSRDDERMDDRKIIKKLSESKLDLNMNNFDCRIDFEAFNYLEKVIDLKIPGFLSR